MNTKLTLTLEASVIREAKQYARAKKTSLSKLAQFYFSSFSTPSRHKAPLPPITAALTGMIRGSVANEKRALTDALIKKHL